MTNKEAIDRLSIMQGRCENGYDEEAFEIAIKSLEKIESIKFNVYAINKLLKEADNDT